MVVQVKRNLLAVEPKGLANRSDMGSKKEGDYRVSAGKNRQIMEPYIEMLS